MITLSLYSVQIFVTVPLHSLGTGSSVNFKILFLMIPVQLGCEYYHRADCLLPAHIIFTINFRYITLSNDMLETILLASLRQISSVIDDLIIRYIYYQMRIQSLLLAFKISLMLQVLIP